MKKAVVVLAGLFFILASAAQEKSAPVKGNGNIIKEKREIGAFKKINVEGPFEVSLVSGKPGALTITGDENILNLVTTDVTNGVLTIAAVNGRQFKTSRNNKIIVKVPFEVLTEITLKGSGTINTKKTVTSNIKINLDGPGNVKVAVDTDTTEAHVKGSGKIKLKGTTESLQYTISGNGNVKADGLEASYVNSKFVQEGYAGSYGS